MEADAIVHWNRPKTDWPAQGAIELRDLALRYRPGYVNANINMNVCVCLFVCVRVCLSTERLAGSLRAPFICATLRYYTVRGMLYVDANINVCVIVCSCVGICVSWPKLTSSSCATYAELSPGVC